MTRSKDPFDDAAKLLDSEFAKTVKESAQQIWLAGLGAFAKAQQEGGKVFESLVKDGAGLQQKTQAAAEEKLSEMSSRFNSAANEMQSKAGQQWDKLEGIFEERIAKALTRLGVPSAKDVADLGERVDALTEQVAQLTQATRVARKTAAKTAAKKAPLKRAPRKPSV